MISQVNTGDATKYSCTFYHSSGPQSQEVLVQLIVTGEFRGRKRVRMYSLSFKKMCRDPCYGTDGYGIFFFSDTKFADTLLNKRRSLANYLYLAKTC